jgi:hypothetical protein
MAALADSGVLSDEFGDELIKTAEAVIDRIQAVNTEA